MFVKLFSSILDSSIWEQDLATRAVWITLLASMNEDGFARFGTIQALARRSNVTLEQATSAVACLESEEEQTASEDDFNGRRIERCPGGWLVLKAKHYRDLASRLDSRRMHAERQRRYRERAALNGKSDASVTLSDDGNVTRDASVTPTSASVSASASACSPGGESREGVAAMVMSPTDEAVQAVADHYRNHHPRARHSYPRGCKEYKLISARLREGFTVEDICDAIDGCHKTPYNLGLNESKTVYLHLALIVRDSEHVNKYMATAREPKPEIVEESPFMAAIRESRADYDERIRNGTSRI